MQSRRRTPRIELLAANGVRCRQSVNFEALDRSGEVPRRSPSPWRAVSGKRVAAPSSTSGGRLPWFQMIVPTAAVLQTTVQTRQSSGRLVLTP